MELKTVYFENPGKENTEEVFRIAKQRAKELRINTILVASTTGVTAVRAMEVFTGMRIIVITHSAGYKKPDFQEFTEENKKIVESKGGLMLTAAHAFAGLDRAMRQSDIPEATATYVIGDIVATTLRIFGQGMKVVCEIATMAADNGLVHTDEDIISIAGTGTSDWGLGADTAVVLQPANAHFFFNTRVKEILCKPYSSNW